MYRSSQKDDKLGTPHRFSTKSKAVSLVSPQSAEVDEQWSQGDSDVLGQLPPEARVRVNSLRYASMPDGTRKAYEAAWSAFSDWCLRNRLVALPATPATLIRYLLDRSELIAEDGSLAYAPSTLRLWVSGINKMHQWARLPQPGRDPLVIETLDAICRQNDRPVRQVRPITTDILRPVLAAMDLTHPRKGAKAHRDYALLCLGLSGAFRRSELAALTMGDLRTMKDQGIKAILRRSKTDQYARGQAKAIPYGTDPRTCPPCALTRWLCLLELIRKDLPSAREAWKRADINGHVCEERFESIGLPETDCVFPGFRSSGLPSMKPIDGKVVADVVKQRLTEAGVDASDYSGHSLRAGFVTQAYRAGASTNEIMRQTGHKNPAMVEIYAREIDPFTVNAAYRLGL